MAGRVLLPTVECVNHSSKGVTVKQNPFIITAAVGVVIVVTAVATLFVLSAFAGQKSGLQKSGGHACPSLSAKAAGDVADPGYAARLELLSRCSR